MNAVGCLSELGGWGGWWREEGRTRHAAEKWAETPTGKLLALFQLSANRMGHWKETMDLVCSRAVQEWGDACVGGHARQASSC